MPVQGVAFKEVAQSLLVLLCGSLISCKKSDYSELPCCEEAKTAMKRCHMKRKTESQGWGGAAHHPDVSATSASKCE